MRIFRKKIKNQRGAALLVILAVSAILIPLVQAVWLDSQIEYQFNRYRMNELQARQNAKSGIALNLLRIYLFKGVEGAVPEKWKGTARPLLDRVWSFPFIWPLIPSEDMLESDKQALKKIERQSFFKGAYVSAISPEDGLLDVNDLSSSLPHLREFTRTALFNLLSLALEKQEKLKDKYQEKDFEELLNNLADWTDLDNDSQNGGSEELLKEGASPLNRSFASVEEIKKTPKMTGELFDILRPHITVYGSKSLNINYASRGMLRALGIPEGLVEEILSRTQISSNYYSPFLDQKSFCDFMNDLGFPFCEGLKERWETLDMLSFGFPLAFRVKSSGEYRGQLVNFSALLFNPSAVSLIYQKSRYYELKRRLEKKRGIEPVAGTVERDSVGHRPEKAREEKPKMDYSYFKNLIIMYLKENF